MKMQMMLLYAMPYKIVDEKTGVINEGISTFFYGNTSLNPKIKDNMKGEKPLKQGLPLTIAHKIKSVPAMYEVEVEMSVGADLKAKLSIIDLDYIGDLDANIIQPDKSKKTA